MVCKLTVEGKIRWCLKQKRSVKIEEPNALLSKAYLKKAKSALNMLASAVEKDEVDWIATTAYYARYFAFYALLQKCGIKSENHDCTVSLMHFLLVDEGMTEQGCYEDLLMAKELRVDTQYYVPEELDRQKLETGSKKAGTFVLEMERIIDMLTRDKIERLRNKMDNCPRI